MTAITERDVLQPVPLTSQQIFDKVLAHLRKQGCQSRHQNDDGTLGSCAYRGAGGTMCAVGCLIPDNVYDERIEGLGVYVSLLTMSRQRTEYEELLVSTFDASAVPRTVEAYGLLGALQRVHDQYFEVGFESEMQRVASDRGLTYTPPTVS